MRDQKYIESIPGLKEKILEGGRTPIGDCIPEADVDWTVERDPGTGQLITPGQRRICLSSGDFPEFECCCDNCDHFLECYPEFQQEVDEVFFMHWVFHSDEIDDADDAFKK